MRFHPPSPSARLREGPEEKCPAGRLCLEAGPRRRGRPALRDPAAVCTLLGAGETGLAASEARLRPRNGSSGLPWAGRDLSCPAVGVALLLGAQGSGTEGGSSGGWGGNPGCHRVVGLGRGAHPRMLGPGHGGAAGAQGPACGAPSGASYGGDLEGPARGTSQPGSRAVGPCAGPWRGCGGRAALPLSRPPLSPFPPGGRGVSPTCL